jgi:hypothetical protein
MKRKRKPSTGEISKYKAGLNVNGKEKVQGAFPQADIERELYMKLPAGFSIEQMTLSEEEKKDHVLKQIKNLYGQKQAGRVWYQHLRKKLIILGFKPSEMTNVYSIMEQQSSLSIWMTLSY